MPKGFTLIELLIVIAILGILTTLGVGNFQSARIKARDAVRKSDLTTVAKSLEAYANDYQSYPASTANGEIEDYPWGDPFVDGNDTIYTAKLPQDSLSPTREYYYNSDGTSYTLYTALENDNDLAFDNSLTQKCGTPNCNYKITSTNLP